MIKKIQILDYFNHKIDSKIANVYLVDNPAADTYIQPQLTIDTFGSIGINKSLFFGKGFVDFKFTTSQLEEQSSDFGINLAHS